MLITCNGITHGGRNIVIGCMCDRTDIFCGICERKTGKRYELCPWSQFGGKTIPALNEQPQKTQKCYWCKMAENKIPH
ncbi:MAG: hypothetical protein UW11_C0046G0010 [Parcubacteria group bacterium GW2011_GWA2_43_9b]|nr:MAG: hypothetical protein UW11_C0046G0010 [Parcubacteria group bacterium GW2011_GWA2_43_9b]